MLHKTDLVSLENIGRKVRKCEKCPAVVRAQQPGYFGEKIQEWAVMFVGQNPGVSKGNKNDDVIYDHASSYEQVNFAYSRVLREVLAGKFVNSIVKDIDPEWEHVAYTNLVKCPTHNNRELNSEEIANCSEYLFSQIHAVNPVVVILIGSAVCQNLVGQNFRKVEKTTVIKDHFKFIPVSHYSYLLRNNISLDAYSESVRKTVAELVRIKKNNLNRFFGDDKDAS